MPPAAEELSPESVVDIFPREPDARVWDRLRTWAEKEARSARTYRRTAETAALHNAGGTGLIRDQELESLLTWWETERPNAEWAKQYPGDWDSVVRLTIESRQAHYRELAEAEFARRWRKTWRPVLIASFFAIFVLFLGWNFQLFGTVASAIAVGMEGLVPKGQEHHDRVTLLILLCFCITVLLGGYFAVVYCGERAFRATQFDRISCVRLRRG